MTVFAVLVAGAAAWWILMSSALAVQQVRVEGVDRLSETSVRRAAAIADGTALVTLDLDAVARRVSELRPVASVEVVRDWPSSVEIRVTERTPVAVRSEGSGWALLDSAGTAFAEVEDRPRRLPALSATGADRPAALKAALRVLAVLPLDVRADVRQVHASTADDVRLRLTKGRTVVWGSDERSARKSAVLAVLLTRKASVYDVSAPDIPTTRA